MVQQKIPSFVSLTSQNKDYWDVWNKQIKSAHIYTPKGEKNRNESYQCCGMIAKSVKTAALIMSKLLGRVATSEMSLRTTDGEIILD